MRTFLNYKHLFRHAKIQALATCFLWAFLIVACNFANAAGSSATLTRVRAAGVLHCGIDEEQAEYSTLDDHGNHAADGGLRSRPATVAVALAVGERVFQRGNGR